MSIFLTQKVALCTALALITGLALLHVRLFADASPPDVPLNGRSQSVNSGPAALCGPVPYAVTRHSIIQRQIC